MCKMILWFSLYRFSWSNFFFLISIRPSSLSFPFIHHYFGAEYKNSPPCASYQDFLLLLFSTHCIVLNFMFMPTMQFEITFVYSVRLGQGSFFFFLLMEIKLIQHNLLTRLSFLWIGFVPLWKFSGAYLCESISESSILLHRSIRLSLSTNTTPSWLQ